MNQPPAPIPPRPEDNPGSDAIQPELSAAADDSGPTQTPQQTNAQPAATQPDATSPAPDAPATAPAPVDAQPAATQPDAPAPGHPLPVAQPTGANHKRSLGALFTILGVMVLALGVVGVAVGGGLAFGFGQRFMDDQNHVEETSPLDLAGATDVLITGDRASISVDSVLSAGQPGSVRMKLRGRLKPIVRVTRTGDTAEVHTECPTDSGSPRGYCRSDLSVSLPAGLGVSIRVNDGDVTARGTMRSLAVYLNNGSVRGKRLTVDSTTVQAVSGSSQLTYIAPPKSVNAQASEQSIVRVPNDATTYKVSSQSGDAEMAQPSHSGLGTPVPNTPTSDRSITVISDNDDALVVKVVPQEKRQRDDDPEQDWVPRHRSGNGSQPSSSPTSQNRPTG